MERASKDTSRYSFSLRRFLERNTFQAIAKKGNCYCFCKTPSWSYEININPHHMTVESPASNVQIQTANVVAPEDALCQVVGSKGKGEKGEEGVGGEGGLLILGPCGPAQF